MTEQKMKEINNWVQKINRSKTVLEVQDKIALAGASMEMLEKIEPIYDKYQAKEKEGGRRW